MNEKKLIVVGGPTASGKTALAIEVATYFSAQILSADSRQVYKELNIGVAKPTEVELNKVPHHFINHRSILHPFNAGDFANEANTLLADLFSKNNIQVLAGGTGLYIKACLDGLDDLPSSTELRAALQDDLEQHGVEYLANKLLTKDPNVSSVDFKNPQRVLRALEIVLLTNKPLSASRVQTSVERFYKPYLFYINPSREELYKIINQRVDKMVEMGLVNEVEQLLPFRNLTTLQTVGYTELFRYFDGEISLEQAVDLIKQNTRRYAKRQLTWFRNQKSFNAINPFESQAIFNCIAN